MSRIPQAVIVVPTAKSMVILEEITKQLTGTTRNSGDSVSAPIARFGPGVAETKIAVGDDFMQKKLGRHCATYVLEVNDRPTAASTAANILKRAGYKGVRIFNDPLPNLPKGLISMVRCREAFGGILLQFNPVSKT